MTRDPEWRILALFGAICTIQVFFDLNLPGPWGASSFTQGAIALFGLLCLYLSWFRLTFGMKGVAPIITRWKRPKDSSKKVILYGFIIIISSAIIGRINFMPEPAGLILNVIGLLTLLCGLYVWASTAGPLLEEE